MLIQPMLVGQMAVYCYIVGDEETKTCLVIDPAGNESDVVDQIGELGLECRYIVNTHGHPDHTCGNLRVQEMTGARIVAHQAEIPHYQNPGSANFARMIGGDPSPPPDVTVIGGDTIDLGDLKLEVLHTPGHTRGGVCLHAPGHVFTGDTLFVGSIGRTDMPGASMQQLMDSIRDKLLGLPDDTVVWPGHDYGPTPNSTIGREKRDNPFVTEFIFGR
ncbi:MAG: MBL fold metallo-hydrolase [Proteobacteria bacterium]|nr:MBL fold metallo-hydrolase [Pseudomonadota bacterium]MBU1742922.1 MBL fold metallo-hydrolase [Pseudomonadota bacterium]